MWIIVATLIDLFLVAWSFFEGHSGEDEGSWTVVNGGNHTAQTLNTNSDIDQCQTETQENLQTSNETANGIVDSNEGQAANW